VPRDNLLITIQYIPASEAGRSICLKPQGERYYELIRQLKKEGELRL